MISITFKVLILLVVLLSHTKFTLRLLTKLRRSEMPKTRDLVIASFLLYYDLGLLLEVCGYEYVNHFFPSTFNAGNSSLELCIAIVALSPWFIDMTAGLWHGTSRIRCKSETTLKPRLRPAFYSTTGILSLGSVALASYFGLNQDIGKHIWVIRTVIGNTLGPYIILLFLPLYVLGFYVRLRESHSRVGVCFIVFLVLCSVTSIIPLGERTFLLMPFVIVFVFWKRTSLRGMVLIGCVSLLGAALLLPFFKWQANVKSAGIDTVSETINSDIDFATYYLDQTHWAPMCSTILEKDTCTARCSLYLAPLPHGRGTPRLPITPPRLRIPNQEERVGDSGSVLLTNLS